MQFQLNQKYYGITLFPIYLPHLPSLDNLISRSKAFAYSGPKLMLYFNSSYI